VRICRSTALAIRNIIHLRGGLLLATQGKSLQWRIRRRQTMHSQRTPRSRWGGADWARKTLEVSSRGRGPGRETGARFRRCDLESTHGFRHCGWLRRDYWINGVAQATIAGMVSVGKGVSSGVRLLYDAVVPRVLVAELRRAGVQQTETFELCEGQPATRQSAR
jgi:hypothetical protein